VAEGRAIERTRETWGNITCDGIGKSFRKGHKHTVENAEEPTICRGEKGCSVGYFIYLPSRMEEGLLIAKKEPRFISHS
jgi:hypothetical protein